MTREEAIKTLKENYCAMCAYGSQDMDSCDIRSCDNKDAIKALEQEPCEDCISLEAVKNTMFMVQRTAFISDNEFHRTMDLLMRLPPVTPAEKVGHWIDGKCNKCGTYAPYWAMASTYYCSEYCPKCGAKMQESEG